MPIILNGTTGITTPGITNTGPFTFQGVVELPAGAVGAPSLTTTGDTNTGIYFPAADTIAFVEGGVESMRLTSAGDVGIGTSSPAYKLDVSTTTGDTQAAIYDRATGSSAARLDFRTSGTGASQWFIQTGNTTVGLNGALRFYNQGTASEVARFDSSGNLGLGVTPSAWVSSIRAMQIGSLGGTVITGNTSAGGSSIFGQNFYFDGAFKYGANGVASYYLQNGGSHVWYTAASGTAGNTITFTQAMTLDASGNLGIGTTSPGAKAEIYVTRTSSTNAVSLILNDNVTGVQTNGVYKAIRSLSNGGSSVSEIRFVETDGTNNNTAIAFATANTAGGLSERMRVLNTGAILALAGATLNASGTGIGFPATQSASTNANVLDDYEEGTWSPSVGGNATYNFQKGSYTKVGRCVTAIFDMSIANIGTGSTTDLGGLPFGSAPSGSPQGIVAPISYWANLAIAVSWVALRLDESSTTMVNQYTTGNQSTASINGAIFQSGTRIIGTITYFV